MEEKEALKRKLAAAQEELRQLQNRQKLLLNKLRDEEYKTRTRRLIVHGANLESVFPAVAAMSAEETMAFLRMLEVLGPEKPPKTDESTE